MTTTTTSGAAIQRYKIGYHSYEWGQRSSTPSGIPDASGSWVRYADHVTALAAGQVVPAQAAPENIRGILARCRDFIDTTKAPAYPAGADLADEIDVLLAAQAVVPAGWKLVPVDATDEMVRATDEVNFENGDTDGTMHNVWNVMIAAAPTQPAAQQGAAYAALPDERAAFEAQFPVPGGVHWDGTEYVVKDSHVSSYRCNRFEGQWEAWNARASHGQAPATQQAGATKEHVRLVRVIADKIEDGTLFRSGIYSNKDLARFVRNVADAAAPQFPTTQAQADSVQEDAARYRWLRRWKGQEHEPPFTLWGGDLDAAIDTARKQGANHD